jgi:hypothetical protein
MSRHSKNGHVGDGDFEETTNDESSKNTIGELASTVQILRARETDTRECMCRYQNQDTKKASQGLIKTVSQYKLKTQGTNIPTCLYYVLLYERELFSCLHLTT